MPRILMRFAGESQPAGFLGVATGILLGVGVAVLGALGSGFAAGAARWALAVAAAGAVGGIAVAVVVARRGPRARHRREESVHHDVLSHAAQPIVSTDPTGLIQTFSRGAERLLGFSAPEVVGQVRLEAFHDPLELNDREADRAIAAGGAVEPGFGTIVGLVAGEAEPSERDWTWLRRDQSRVPVRLSITPLRDALGRISGYFAIASDLTEHKLAEERRREFDTRLSKIASQVPGMVFQFKQRPDGSRCFPYASDGMRRLFQLEPAELMRDSKLIWSRIHPDDAGRVAHSINTSAQSLERWTCEFRTRLPDGSEHWHEGTALPERQPDGSVLWHGLISDITERKRAERSHEESRALLQSVFSSVDLGVFVVDVTNGGEFRFVEVNPAYERLTGISAAQWRGKGPRELVPLIPTEMAECLRASLRRGVESTGPIEYEEPFYVQGRLLWWLTRLAPLRDGSGNVIRLVGRSLDITDRKTIELRFQSLTERLQLATEAAQAGIWDYDVNANRVVWDQRMHTLYGLTAPEFDGTFTAWRECVHPDDIDRAERELREAMEGAKPFNTSFRILWPDGEQREIRACAHVQRNPAGRAIRMVGINWDVTAERRAQAEIELARDEAEKLNRKLQEALERAESYARAAKAATTAKSEFLANMSHEIRTPLNAVIGMSGLLLGTELSREQREFAGTIRSSGDGLLALINDILDYSKIESGRLDLEQRVFDLRECVESSIDVLAAKAAEKKLDLLYQMSDGMPEAVVGDDTRLRQVIVNLVGNAVKFTTRGEVFVSVGVTALREDGRVLLHIGVHDSGIGIPEDRMDRLFKTFSQVDASTTRQFGGTGLGLAITKKIVELMHGSIWVESTPGRGSTFHFEIEVPGSNAPVRPWAAARATFSGKRVLIVDDNPTNCRVLCQQAIAWGLMPRGVASAAEALRVFEQESNFDLALIDVEMPEMSGLQLTGELRARGHKELRVVLLSSPGGPKPEAALGVAGMLNKPIKPAAFFEVAVGALQGHASRDRPTVVLDAVNLGEEHPLAVLLTDDNPVNQRVALLMLQRLGYRADVASNGLEALEAVARQSYDLVLMDVQMPEMDGLQATREICRRWPPNARPRIVAMTANALVSDRDACLAAGMDDFLTKPVRAADLKRALQQTSPRNAIVAL